MADYRYLIIGGGMTADAAVRGIREVDREGSIGVISGESHAPYNRPPLSKGLWKGQPIKNIWRKQAARASSLHLGRWVQSIDRSNKLVVDDQGANYRYEKLLLATGGTPRRLPAERGGDLIRYYRTLDDYQSLRALVNERQRFAVIGGGFIGAELAAALTINGKQVVMVFPERTIGGRVFPSELGEFLNGYYHEKGVDLRPGEEVLNIEERESQYVVRTQPTAGGQPREIRADAVVAGLGIEPNVELAKQAGLDVGNGVRVDMALRTSDPSIYAAGDVAEFFNPALDARIRVEHEDNANTMGAMVGESMAGQSVSYEHLPYFYSDLFDLGYEAIGQTDARLETVTDWKEPNREGVIYYVQQGRVRGVVLWNVWERVDAARQLIGHPGPFRPEDLRGRLLEAHQNV